MGLGLSFTIPFWNTLSFMIRVLIGFLVFFPRHVLLASCTPDMAGSLLTLGLMWAVIGFLVFYLRQLLKENARIRKLYR